MADGVSRGAVAPGFNHRPRLKPTIYKTDDGQVIVEDEFLNFLAVKIKTMTQDDLVLVASNTFHSEWIETSKKALFELCPETKQRCVAFKGNQKDANNIKSCLKVLNECGEDIPRFVSHYLDELPPVTFSNLDVSNLLSRMERLHSEVCALRHTVEVQAEISEDLRTMAVTMDNRVAAVEGRLKPGDGGGLAVSDGPAIGGGSGPHDGPVNGAAHVASAPGTSVAGEPACVEPVAAAIIVTTCMSPGKTAPNSPRWSQVVKQGRGRSNNPEGQSVLLKQRAGKPERRMPKPIVGTAAQKDIKVVRTKLVSVFATKFSPDLDAETLSIYLTEQLGRYVNCQRIVTAGNRYSSFKVCAECDEVAEMYNPELWPEGSLVRRYYEPRKVGVIGAGAARSVSSAIVPNGSTDAMLS